jgi:hypothetical protein
VANNLIVFSKTIVQEGEARECSMMVMMVVDTIYTPASAVGHSFFFSKNISSTSFPQQILIPNSIALFSSCSDDVHIGSSSKSAAQKEKKKVL